MQFSYTKLVEWIEERTMKTWLAVVANWSKSLALNSASWSAWKETAPVNSTLSCNSRKRGARKRMRRARSQHWVLMMGLKEERYEIWVETRVRLRSTQEGSVSAIDRRSEARMPRRVCGSHNHVVEVKENTRFKNSG